MGDTHSAQRDSKDTVADEESTTGDDVQAEDKSLQNNGQISGLNTKTDIPTTEVTAEVNGHCEDEVFVEACETSSDIVPPKEDVPEMVEAHNEDETPLENDEITEKESVDPDQAAPPNISETEVKLNEINEGFKRFFSNIGLKLTVKKDSGTKAEVPSDVSTEQKEVDPSDRNDAKDTIEETKDEIEETPDNDSTTCPTMTSWEFQDNAEEKTTETTEANEETSANEVAEAPTSATPAGEGDATPAEDPEKEPEEAQPSSTSPNEDEEVMSPIKRFFTTGIFAGLRKKKKPIEQEKAKDEVMEKELLDMGTQDDAAKTEGDGQDQEHIKDITVEAATVGEGKKESELKAEITPVDSTMKTHVPVVEELLSSQEKIKVQGSPLKRLLSGSSFKKVSKKQRGRRSSDSKLTDSGEHDSDHLLSSTESAEDQRGKSPARSPEEAGEVEDGTWASFKKLVTPKKHMKKASLSDEEAVTSCSPEEPKPSEEGQISDATTEDTKKATWEAFLCGSGRRRSRKTSDSEDEIPKNEGEEHRPGSESRHAAESPLESSQEGEGHLASSPDQAGSPSEDDGSSTWKSLKRLMTPKRKAKDEEERKEHIPSDSEMNKDESSFSLKKLLPGRKKRKSTEKHEQISSDEADRGEVSDDEDSETPAVVPLSEFDTEDQVQTQALIESHTPEAKESESQQDLSRQTNEAALPSEPVVAEIGKGEDSDIVLEKQSSAIPALNEEFEDLTELSKHQQLSDIPEEGVIEESMATAAEEAARDDTIAEDIIELTSEAITAPEPVDITQTDETEMVSAVSQLTESSKTSGNTTPVPPEYDVMETEALLQEVVEAIYVNPNAVAPCAQDPSVERIDGSVSPQIQEISILQETTNTKAFHKSEAPTAEDVNAVDEIGGAQPESISEVTEVISEDTTEEFDTAVISVDQVHPADVSEIYESVKEEFMDEVNDAAPTEPLPKNEHVDMAIVNEGEIISTEVDSNEVDSTAAVKYGTVDDNVVNMAQAPEEKDQINDKAPDEVPQHAEVVDEDQVAEVVGEVQALTSLQVATLNSEEGSAQVLEKQVISEDIPAPDNTIASVTDEPIQEVHITEINVEVKEGDLSGSKMEAAEGVHADVMAEVDTELQTPTVTQVSPEDLVGSSIALEKETEFQTEQMVEMKEDQVCVPQTAQVQDEDQIAEVVEELQAITAVQVSSVNSEPVRAAVLEQQVISEDIPESCGENVTASVKDEIENQTAILTEPVSMEKENDIEQVPQHVLVVDEGQIAEVANELHEVTFVNSATEMSVASSAPVFEKPVIAEDTPEPDTENASASAADEPIQEAHLTEVNVEGEKETDLPDITVEAVEVVHAPVMQALTCDIKDVISNIPDAEIADTSDITEPLTEFVATEIQSQEANECVSDLPPCLKDDMVTSAQESDVVVMMHVPSQQVEDNHRIQVQVVDVDMKSVMPVVESTLDVGVIDTTGVIDVCNDMDDEVDKLSATSQTEEEITDEASKLTIAHGVIPHEKLNLPEVVNEPIVAESCEMSESKSRETAGERQAEELASTDAHKEESKVELQKEPDVDVAEDSQCTPEPLVEEGMKNVVVEEDTPQTNSYQVDEASNAELVVPQSSGLISSVGNMEAPDSLSLECKLNILFGQTRDSGPQPPVPEITEPIKHTEVSDIGVQATEKIEPIREADVTEQAKTLVPEQSEAAVQVTESVEPKQTEVTEGGESQKQPEISEVAVQAMETTELVRQEALTERAVIYSQPVLSQLGIHTTETVDLVQETKPTETAKILIQPELSDVTVQATETTESISQEVPVESAVIYSQPVLSQFATETVQLIQETNSVQTTVIMNQPELSEIAVQALETIKPVTETIEKVEKVLNQPVQAETCVQIIETVQPVQPKEEEPEQDVWLDAEENICDQGGTGNSGIKAVESVEILKENDQPEKEILDHDEVAQHCHTQEEQRQEETAQIVQAIEMSCESEEEFAIACEPLEIAAATETALSTTEFN